MRNIFIVNPAAGKHTGNESFIHKIKEAAENVTSDCEIYMTTGVGDGTAYVRMRCETAEPGEELRFFACGGDGTLNEVVNGIYGFENASFGVVPIGTGNDFIRNFGPKELFLDIEAQLAGTLKTIDSISYESEYEGETKNGQIINMLNVGFDANVVDITNVLKEKPLISGSLAYILGVVILLVKKKGASVKIVSEGDVLHDGKILLSAFTNGCYCGGGWKGIPLAITDDGLLDISIVKDIKRREFLGLVTKYQKGTHLETKAGKKFVAYNQRKSVEITAVDGHIRACIDGEMMDSDKMILKINPSSMRFVLPKGI